MRNASSTIVHDDQLSAWPRSSTTTLPEDSTSSKEDYRDFLEIYSRCHPSQLSEPRKNDYAVEALPTKRRSSPGASTWVLDWSIWRDQFSSKTKPGRTSHNRPYRSSVHWATRLCLIQYSQQRSQPLNTAFSSVSTASSATNASKTMMIPRALSMLWWPPRKKDFNLSGINRLVSHLRKFVDCNDFKLH